MLLLKSVFGIILLVLVFSTIFESESILAPSLSNGRANETDKLSIKRSEHSFNKEHRFYINESTKVIYIDETNERGLLIGEVGTSVNNQEGLVDGGTTNYTVFLVSKHKEHIAVLIDVEKINFESIINCENQELRLSIVGEIENGLLERMETSLDETLQDTTPVSEVDPSSTDFSENAHKDDRQNLLGESMNISSTTDVTASKMVNEVTASHGLSIVDDHEPIVPVTEAMSLLLNSFMNKTILEEPEELNNFKTIDFCIDYIREETCREIRQERHNQIVSNSSLRANNGLRNENRTRVNERKQGKRRRMKSRRKGKAIKGEARCPLPSAQFKEIMAQKLNKDFEWDEFRIICGMTRQLLIPMRSLKLSVYSDEFSPNSQFILSYKFISDPSQLQAKDNNKFYCRNRKVIDLSMKCDNYDDCGDASDESIKICGYPPTNRPVRAATFSTSTNHERFHSPTSNLNNNEARKLVHYSGELLNCCQTNDWMSIANQYQQQNLQTLMSDSMNLFSGLLLAPTNNNVKARRRTKRIVGGGVAQRGAWPSQVSLQYEILEPLSHFCAGTLIHPLYVITAGHCITRDAISRGIKVVLGAHDLRQLSGDNVQVRYVDDAQIYPGVDVKHLSYDWDNDMNNDIALIRLNAPIIISHNVAPACLPPFNTPLSINTTCRSIGWGQTHGSGNSNLLKHISLKVVNSSVCSEELIDKDTGEDNDKEIAKQFDRMKLNSVNNQRRNKIKREKIKGLKVGEFEASGVEQYSDLTMLCVNNDHGHGICQGDSGGPLYCDRIASNGDQCTEIYGVASFIIQYATVGAMCAVENLPGIFGEVSSKTEWIASTMKMFEQTYRLKYS